MLNHIIAASLKNRAIVLLVALLVGAYGFYHAVRMPIDVLPDLNRPVVTVLTEAHGLVPEDVERLVTRPLEQAMNGATGVETVRSSSGAGLSVVNIEFAWGTDLWRNRQLVQERLAAAQRLLPPGLEPELAPVSSLVGQILNVGLSAADGAGGSGGQPADLRTLADTLVKPRILSVAGVAQVVVIGGAPRELQIVPDARALRLHGITLEEVANAVRAANKSGSGGILPYSGEGPAVTVPGLVREPGDVAQAVVKPHPVRPVPGSRERRHQPCGPSARRPWAPCGPWAAADGRHAYACGPSACRGSAAGCGRWAGSPPGRERRRGGSGRMDRARRGR